MIRNRDRIVVYLLSLVIIMAFILVVGYVTINNLAIRDNLISLTLARAKRCVDRSKGGSGMQVLYISREFSKLCNWKNET